MNELLLCALRRLGRPATAADITDTAVGLALDAGWPRHHYEGNTTKKVAAAMGKLERAGLVRREGEERSNGNDRPLWAPSDGTFDLRAPVPVPPPPALRHALDGRTQAQAFAMFDGMDEFVVLGQRHLQEQAALVDRHMREYQSLTARVRSRLAVVGLPGEDDA